MNKVSECGMSPYLLVEDPVRVERSVLELNPNGPRSDYPQPAVHPDILGQRRRHNRDRATLGIGQTADPVGPIFADTFEHLCVRLKLQVMGGRPRLRERSRIGHRELEL
jgi:hypothetical protein